jgi:hypothetical protein
MGNLSSDEESLRWAMILIYGNDEDYEDWYETPDN